MPEWYFESARVLAHRIRKRELSSVELLESFLARVDKVNPPLNAVIALDLERARAEAKRADELLASGKVMGPLHGVPMTVKESFELTGMRTTSGSKRWQDHVSQVDAVAVRRLRDAGAIIFGKTNIPAFTSDWQSFNEIYGVTNNPWDVKRTPGGSSGGAAAALAAGLTPIELGSDIAGSIRLPAAFCGVFGHKPTHDLIPMIGHVPPEPGSVAGPDLAVCGPMARTADDLALLLPLLAGPMPLMAKAYSVKLPPPRAASLRGYRIASWIDEAGLPLASEVRLRLSAAIDSLRKAGAVVEDVHPEFTLAESHALYRQLLDPVVIGAASPRVIDQMRALAETPGDDPLAVSARNAIARHAQWLVASEKRMKLRAALEKFFVDYDVILCPVVPVPAIPHDHRVPQFVRTIAVDGEERSYLDIMTRVSLATVTGNPATSLPVGRTKEGLPVGMQVIGPYLEDFTPIDVAGRIAEVVGGFQPPPGY